jgi:hypothetical protein
MIRAKHVLSKAEGTQSTPSSGSSYFAPFAFFAVKSSPPRPAPGSSEGGHAGPPLPYNLFYVPFVVKSLLLFGRGVVTLLNRHRFKNLP